MCKMFIGVLIGNSVSISNRVNDELLNNLIPCYDEKDFLEALMKMKSKIYFKMSRIENSINITSFSGIYVEN